MSKKHFIELADHIRTIAVHDMQVHGTTVPMVRYQDMLDELAHFCKRQNSAFNRSRWFGYITGENGPSGGKVKAKTNV